MNRLPLEGRCCETFFFIGFRLMMINFHSNVHIAVASLNTKDQETVTSNYIPVIKNTDVLIATQHFLEVIT